MSNVLEINNITAKRQNDLRILLARARQLATKIEDDYRMIEDYYENPAAKNEAFRFGQIGFLVRECEEEFKREF